MSAKKKYFFLSKEHIYSTMILSSEVQLTEFRCS